MEMPGFTWRTSSKTTYKLPLKKKPRTMIKRRFRDWWQPPEKQATTFLELFYDLVYVVLIFSYPTPWQNIQGGLGWGLCLFVRHRLVGMVQRQQLS